jgi:nicotinamidase-related amidase
MRILKENSAGLIIDIQEKLFPFIFENEQLTRNTQILIEGLKVLDVPLIVTQQYTKGLGETITPVAESLGDFKYLEKTAFSCCDDNGFNIELAETNRKFIIITGIETHVCVLQTTIDLLEKNFIPVVVEDCVSSRRLNDKNFAIERMRREGAVITTYESILFELLRYSGTDQFKAISKLVK